MKIQDLPLVPLLNGNIKIPTGGFGVYAVSVDQIAAYSFSQGLEVQSTNITTQQPSGEVRSQLEKNADNLTPYDFGCIGDGVADDHAGMVLFASRFVGAGNLAGGLYKVNSIPSIPTGKHYTNGRFLLPDGQTIQADSSQSTITGLTDTGGLETAYTGGKIPVPTVSGRTNKHLRVLVGSQNCRATFARSGNYTSIYSQANGNLSANLTSRQSTAECPQSINIGSEECTTQGFGAGNYTAHYSNAVGARVANLATRFTDATGFLAANIASQDSTAGRGSGLKTQLIFTAGVLTGITILNGGVNYDANYQKIYLYDRLVSPSAAASVSFTTDVNGTITSFTILSGGGGYSSNVYLGVQMVSRGFGLDVTPVVNATDGGIDSYIINNGGMFYTLDETIRVLDLRKGVDENGEVIEPADKAYATFTVNSSGTITTITPVSRGSGYSQNVNDTNIDCISKKACQANVASAGSLAWGRQTANFAAHFSTADGSVSANYCSNRGKTEGTYSFTLASDYSTARGTHSGTIGCATTDIDVAGIRCIAVASDGCTVRGTSSALIACSGATRTDSAYTRQAAIGTTGSIVRGNGSVILAGNIVETSTVDQAVAMGRRVINNTARSFVLGDSSGGSASTANKKFQVLPTGAVTAAGTITGSTTFTDYAEYFENLNIGTIPLGTLVALNGKKVRPVVSGDSVLGVISGTALVAAGDSPFTWSGRYLTGEFGEMLYEDVDMVKWDGYDGSVKSAPKIPNDAVFYTEQHPKENPLYDPTAEQIPRSKRPDEWSCVGLLGQVYVRVDPSVSAGDWVKAGSGVGVKSTSATNIKAMEITTPYNATKGYAVAFCLLK